MSYAAFADFVASVGEAEATELTDAVGAGVPDAAVYAAAAADVDAEIDGYLAGRYALPLSPVPRLIVRIACDMARYRLWREQASDEVRRRFEDARRLLEAIAAGRVQLDAPRPAQEGLTGGTLEVAPGTRPRDWGVLQ
ncbi:gp436 family protein [Zestomonas thermotolerans]|uniref:gp436 family protein n=1 Tax=Zestomonas thermotolerans TaxID=157784 RepID=UPI00037BF974|nr:DUF1320 domain-containing protein [Pseudomonas thermotolerans]